MNGENFKIAAVAVTHNRINLLKECIDSLRNQTRKVDKIIVVNNSSTDGTLEWLNIQDDLTVITQDNLGSAGGQYAGIKFAVEEGFDWIWCMDDDCVPNSNALGEFEKFLCGRFPGKIGFLASRVLWTDLTPHVMNLPAYFYNKNLWNFIGYDKLASGNHAIDACSFVSCLFNANAVKQVGYPNPEFFIWFDDLEYTIRFRTLENYYISSSVVIHKTASNSSVELNRIERELSEKKIYGIRNFLYIYRKWNKYLILNFSLKLGCRLLWSVLYGKISLKTFRLYITILSEGWLGQLKRRSFQ